jgi:hypothetical protein
VSQSIRPPRTGSRRRTATRRSSLRRKVEQTSSGLADSLAVGLSFAAFVIAVLAFYLGSVKRADIWLALVPDRHLMIRMGGSAQLPDGRLWPTHVVLVIPLIAANSGAGAGVLTDVSLVGFEEHPPEPVLFIDYGPLPRAWLNSMDSIDGGAVRYYLIEIPLPRSISSSEELSVSVSMLKAILERKDALTITLGYSFLMGRSLLPWRRRIALDVRRELRFPVGVKQLLEEVRG